MGSLRSGPEHTFSISMRAASTASSTSVRSRYSLVLSASFNWTMTASEADATATRRRGNTARGTDAGSCGRPLQVLSSSRFLKKATNELCPSLSRLPRGRSAWTDYMYGEERAALIRTESSTERLFPSQKSCAITDYAINCTRHADPAASGETHGAKLRERA